MVPFQITFKGFHSSDSAWLAVQKRIEKLEVIYNRIVHCDVILTKNHRHRRGNHVYKVQVHIFVPGKEIMINHDPTDNHVHRDLLVTIRDAFDSAELALEKSIQLIRHNTKHHYFRIPQASVNESEA